MILVYNRSELARFKRGVVVEVMTPTEHREVHHVGHVVGFEVNAVREVLISVACEDGFIYRIHPHHLQVL